MKAPQRRRAAIAAILATAAGVFGWGLPASAGATDGWHHDLFTCSAAAAPAEEGRLLVSLNALRVDLEVTPGHFVEISPSAKGYWKFANSDTPMIRVRCYGMGAGDTASDAAHNDADYHLVE